MSRRKRNPICQIFHQKIISESFDENWWNGGCFSKISRTRKTTFLTLASPRGYTLYLKALIKVSKVSWTSHLSYKILRSSFQTKVRNKLHFSKKTPPKSLGTKNPQRFVLFFDTAKNKKVNKQSNFNTNFYIWQPVQMTWSRHKYITQFESDCGYFSLICLDDRFIKWGWWHFLTRT